MHCWLSLPGCKVRVALSPEAASARARELQPAACRPLWPRFFMLSHTCVSAGSVSLAEAWDHTFRRTFELRSLRISVVWDQQGLPVYNCSVVSDSSRPHGLQHARLPCPSPSPGAYSNSCPLSQWFHPAISSSVVPFSSYPQSFPASGSFPVSRLFSSDDQNTGASASL